LDGIVVAAGLGTSVYMKSNKVSDGNSSDDSIMSLKDTNILTAVYQDKMLATI
jgi:hypothetical protein